MNENNYGFAFNDITIMENTFNKNAKNSFGKLKINNEIAFYLYIFKNNIQFPMPKFEGYSDGSLQLQYIRNSSILTNKINTTNITHYIHEIRQHLQLIHCITQPVTDKILFRDLNIELKTKILDRYNTFDWDSNRIYSSIKSVNNVKIRPIDEYCNIIYNKIAKLLDTREYYNLIHGDVHLGNILITDTEEMMFIDPRGYFGESKLFGIYEYDYAKLLFGLSGYSAFDNMTIDELNITDGGFNIEIDFIKQYEYIFETEIFDKITMLFCLSIWLANNSCFSNINKKLTSLMIAYYYCEKYIDRL